MKENSNIRKKVIPRIRLWRKNRVTFRTKGSLAPASVPLLNQELIKKLAHRKLVGVVILDNRVIIVNKHPRPTERNNKTSAHKNNWLSMSELKNRVVLRKNSAIRKFKQHIKWYTIPPPGGGGKAEKMCEV